MANLDDRHITYTFSALEAEAGGSQVFDQPRHLSETLANLGSSRGCVCVWGGCWKDGSAVKSTCYSFRRLELCSQHPHQEVTAAFICSPSYSYGLNAHQGTRVYANRSKEEERNLDSGHCQSSTMPISLELGPPKRKVLLHFEGSARQPAFDLRCPLWRPLKACSMYWLSNVSSASCSGILRGPAGLALWFWGLPEGTSTPRCFFLVILLKHLAP